MILTLNRKECRIIPNNTLEEAVELRFGAISKGESMLYYYGLSDWSIECQRVDDMLLGICRYSTKTIIINTIYFHILDSRSIQNALLHEIAHAIVGNEHDHDEIWRAKAIEIGCDGKKSMGVKGILNLVEDTN
jgi:hypothetical protein